MNYKKISKLTLIVVSSFILVGCGATGGSSEEAKTLAQCLTDKGAIMYGTNRCKHCAATKALFGYEAFAKINFVDCDKNKNACGLAGVNGYPTWVINGQKLEGEQTFSKLAEAAGCVSNGEVATEATNTKGATNGTGN